MTRLGFIMDRYVYIFYSLTHIRLINIQFVCICSAKLQLITTDLSRDM